MYQQKKITPLQWIPAKEVLGGEASDFTPWLADNLDVLGASLGLSDIRLEMTEAPVQGKSLDILATGVDQDDNEFPVVIENQYGETNHRHLGQLVTYLAQYGKGYAVWVTEDYHSAHSAAINFLNRTSPEDVNYFLVQVRFTHGADEAHQVYFELVEKPNVFAKVPGKSSSTGFNINRRDYLQQVLKLASPELAKVGYKNIRMHSHGAYMYMRLPVVALDEWGASIRLSVTRNEAILRLVISGEDRARNSAALDVIRERYETLWQSLLPGEPEFEWHATTATAQSDIVLARRPGVGYENGTPEESASWATKVATNWLFAFEQEPLEDLPSLVDSLLSDSAPELDV